MSYEIWIFRNGQPDRDDDRKNFVAKDFNINVALLE